MKTIFYEKVPKYPKNTPIFCQKLSSMKKGREGLVVLKIPNSRICNSKRVVGVFRGDVDMLPKWPPQKRGKVPRADGGPFGEHIDVPPKRPHQRGLPFHTAHPDPIDVLNSQRTN